MSSPDSPKFESVNPQSIATLLIELESLPLNRMKACIVVLGDVGRSPRMNFHALSLANHAVEVTLVGYRASKLHPLISSSALIHPQGLFPPPQFLTYLPRSIALVFKLIWLSAALLFTLLFCVGLPDIILLQNPPGIPSMAICWVISRLKRARLIVDWHNYTYSILSMELAKQGSKIPKAVVYAEKWERFWGPKADLNLCVTHAMREQLLQRWGVRAVTLYDRPPSGIFRMLDTEEKHDFFLKMAADKMYDAFWSREINESELLKGNPEVTRFSYRDNNGIAQLRDDRPLLLVSSTSWTADEDFSVLLQALHKYDNAASHSRTLQKESLPALLAVITGKGPMKQFYLDQIEQYKWNHVGILTPWLEPQDYPRMLGCADMGVSLHTSSSGVDLPMKVVDMFGCYLPVLAKKFKCIDELVKEGENGHLFNNWVELADWIMRLAKGYPLYNTNIAHLKNNLVHSPLVSWQENWDSTIWPLLNF